MTSTNHTDHLTLRSRECHIDGENGADEPPAEGSSTRPYKTLGYAYIQNIDHPTKHYLVRTSDTTIPEGELEWKAPAKSAVKKAEGVLERHKKKLEKQQSAEEENRRQHQAALERASSIVVSEDPSLPRATRITIANKDIKLGDEHQKGTRVKVCGRIHRMRAQKHATFITLTDGYGHLQCVLEAGNLTMSRDALLMAQGTSVAIYGELRKVPQGHSAPDDRELHVDFYRVIGAAPSDLDSLQNKVSASQNQWDSAMLDNRHLVLRGDNASSLMKLRATVELAFIGVYRKMNFTKVSPPALVQTQVEGGSTLFKVPYYDEVAFLTQSSQLYLESVLPGLGNVYAIEKSYRAEKSLTRRHLSEFTHIEGELDFIEFDDLLDHLEELICAVIDTVLAKDEMARFIKAMNPDFQKPSRPFMRMRYSDAIDWLNSQDPPILNEEDKPHQFGDDIAEAAERKMTDHINRPILLTHFPADLKAFYMKKDPSDPRLTESVDLLMPGVGEIAGASMRMEGYEELMDAFRKHGLSEADYYWYSDARKYGTSPHGGYGIGLERFIAWLAKQHTVRTACLYPRFIGRCGMIIATAVMIPCLIAMISEAQTLLTTWNVLCEYFDKVMPPPTIFTSLLYGNMSWMRHRVATGAAPWRPFAITAVLILATIPFTLTVMAPTCETLFRTKTATEMSRDEAIIAIQRGNCLHTVRTLLQSRARCWASWTC